MSAPPRRALVDLVVSVVLLGCYADPPPPVDPSSLPSCSAGSYGVLGTDRCESDDDCAVCTSEAGTARAIARERRVDPASGCTEAPDTIDVACCERRCTVVASGPLF